MQEWSATVTLPLAVSDDQAADLVAELSAFGAAVLVREYDSPPTTTVQVTVEAPSLAVAAEQAVREVDRVLTAGVEPVALEVITVEEQDRRLVHPAPIPVVGVDQIAELLDVTRQRVQQLVDDDPTFPTPVVVLPGATRSRKLWTEAAALAYVRRRLADSPGSGPRPRLAVQ